MLHVPKKTSLINSDFNKAKKSKQKLKIPKVPRCLYFYFECYHIIFICKWAKIERRVSHEWNIIIKGFEN